MKYILPLLICISQGTPPLKKFQLHGTAQGTTWQITYFAADSIVALRQIDSILNQIDSSLSLYKPFSLINRFNQAEKKLEVDKHFITVVNKSIETYCDTKHVFDITVQPLVKAWGFGNQPVNQLPDSQQVKSILRCIGSNKLSVHRNTVMKKIPCITIDVNGIAQGYSVDVVADFFLSKGIINFVVEIGGEIRIAGRRQPSGEMMRIGIEAPGDINSPYPIMEKIIALDNGAITTSGNYRKYSQSGGTKINHLIDPSTGYPVNNELISVTVFAKDAITADAYDNALMVMGLKNAMKFIEARKNMAAHFIYIDQNGNIADTASSRFLKLIRN